MLPSCLLVVHDACRGGEDDVAKRTSWEDLGDDSLNLAERDVVSWGDAGALVDSAKELDDNLACSVVVDDFEFTNVAWRGTKEKGQLKCSPRANVRRWARNK